MKKINPQFYLFFYSKNELMIKKFQHIFNSYQLHKFDSGDTSYCCSIRTDSITKSDKFLFFNGMNLFDKNNIEEEEKLSADAGLSHTLISYVKLNENEVIIKSDRLGVFPHYYFKDNQSFIISNNIFLVNLLVESDYSLTGLYETLIFKKPLNATTWFEKISTILPGNSIFFNIKKFSFEIKEYFNIFSLLIPEKINYISTFRDYFDHIGNYKALEENYMALSAGSDSRTVLSGLRYSKIPFKSVSWGDEDYLETVNIRSLVKNLKLDWDIINFQDLIVNYKDILREGIFLSNGMLPSIHLFYFRTKIRPGSNLFEGYGGSELYKGELSDGMVTSPYSDILTGKLSVTDSINSNLKEIEGSFNKNLLDYLISTHIKGEMNVNSDEGFKKFQKHLLSFIPTKVFSGVFNFGIHLNLNFFDPYFSPLFLKSVFSNNLGIVKNVSLRKDFPGTIKILSLQANIIKELDPMVYKTVLDRGISFRESQMTDLAGIFIRKTRLTYKKYVGLKKYPMMDQVNYKKILKEAEIEESTVHPFIENICKTKIDILKSNPLISYASSYMNYIDEVKSNDILSSFIKRKSADTF
jgi:hypothetical protein